MKITFSFVQAASAVQRITVDFNIHITDKCLEMATKQCGRFICGMHAVENLATEMDRIQKNLVLNLSDLQVSNSLRCLLCRDYQFAPLFGESLQRARIRTRKCIDTFLCTISDRLNFEEFEAANPNWRTRPSTSQNASKRSLAPNWRAKFRRSAFKAHDRSCSELSFDHHQLLNLWRSVLYNSLKNSRIFSVKNISKDELSAFRAIRDQIKSGHITVRKADKSRQVVLMNTDAYVKAVTDLLSSPSYEKVAFNGKFKCSALIIQTVKKYAEALTTSERRDLLLYTRNPASRAFYALPKTHKDRSKWKFGLPPFRPICPDVRTETSMSAKFVAAFLSPFVEKIHTYVRNSYQLVSMLNNLRFLPSSAVWLAADVDQLYPSILLMRPFPPFTIWSTLEIPLLTRTPLFPGLCWIFYISNCAIISWNLTVNAGCSNQGSPWARPGPLRWPASIWISGIAN